MVDRENIYIQDFRRIEKMEENKNEQNKNERPIKPDKNTDKRADRNPAQTKTKAEMVKEKRLYLYTAISCAVALVAIVVIAIATAIAATAIAIAILRTRSSLRSSVPLAARSSALTVASIPRSFLAPHAARSSSA